MLAYDLLERSVCDHWHTSNRAPAYLLTTPFYEALSTVDCCAAGVPDRKQVLPDRPKRDLDWPTTGTQPSQTRRLSTRDQLLSILFLVYNTYYTLGTSTTCWVYW